MRLETQKLNQEFNHTEDYLRSFQVCGQSVAEVLKQVDDERFIIKESNGPRYVVGVRDKINKKKLTAGTRVALDIQTRTIMRILPREVDPVVFNMLADGNS
ncbi:MAG: hypothetical protein P4L10_17485 [Acidobacteriaceae bacterium]|nr:hypothetical protein [Acidobacteriaceae bacterium]